MSRMTLLRWATALAAFVTTSMQQPSAYVLNATKWNSAQVPFYVNTQNLDVNSAAALEAIQFGAYAWTNQSAAAFSFYYAGPTSSTTAANNGKNEVFFRNASYGTAIAITYTWSSGGRTIDTDIIFWDGTYTFFAGNSGCSGGFYIEDIATHEFGHALGLGHSADAEATMVSGARYCAIDHRWLAEDDRRAVEYLYPSGSVNRAPVVSVTSPAEGVSVPSGASLSFVGSATDAEDGNLGSSLVWVSNRDGQIGTGPSFEATLSAGDHTVTATVTDSSGQVAEAHRNVTVATSETSPETPPETPPAQGAFALTANGYKVKGLHKVELTWSGATANFIEIFRDGVWITTAGNNGGYTDAINRKGAGVYTYVVCEAGTSTCSSAVRVTF